MGQQLLPLLIGCRGVAAYGDQTNLNAVSRSVYLCLQSYLVLQHTGWPKKTAQYYLCRDKLK